jgi:uncharacterized membrane protein
MTHVLMILGLVFMYFLIGVLYLTAYVLVYRPEPADAQLGLTVLFWWVYVIVEIVASLAFQFGRFGSFTVKAMDRRAPAPGRAEPIEEKVI